jgi:hypothetical protein
MPAGDDDRLFLHVYPELTLAARTSGSLPYLQDLGSPLSEVGWVTDAEINPRTAERLGLARGSMIKIMNDRGQVTARVQISPAIRPDIIAVQSGGGRGNGGRYAAGIGSNPLRLVKLASAGDLRRVDRDPVLVRVERAG